MPPRFVAPGGAGARVTAASHILPSFTATAIRPPTSGCSCSAVSVAPGSLGTSSAAAIATPGTSVSRSNVASAPAGMNASGSIADGPF